MKMIRKFIVAGIIILTGCSGSMNFSDPSASDHTLEAPTLVQIRTELGTNNQYGMIPGLALGGIILPECTQEDGSAVNFDVIYSIGNPPNWLSFDSSTRAVALATGTTVPAGAYTAAEVTYTCTDDADSSISSSRTFTVNDLDGGSVVDGSEYEFGEVPLVNPTGYFWLNPGDVDFYRPTITSFLIPTGIVSTTVGMDPTNALDDIEDFDGDTGIAGGGNNAEEVTAGTNLFVYATGGTFAAGVNYDVGDGSIDVATADFDGDGYFDLAVTNGRDGTISVFLSDGDGTFAAEDLYATELSPYGIGVADLNADGNIDMAVVNGGAMSFSMFPGNGDGTFAAKVDFVVAGQPYWIALADLNGDGYVDVVTGNQTELSISVLLNNNGTTFDAEVQYAAGLFPRFVTTADFNGDGNIDVATAVVTDDPEDDLLVWLGNGDGTLADPTPYAIESTPSIVAAADFDGDGDIDLVVVNNGSDNVSVLLGNGDGTFAADVTYGVGTGPLGVIASDLDGDGDIDLAVTNSTSDDVSVLLGTGDGTFAADVIYSSVGTGPSGVTTADLDNDGDIDFAVVNNTSDNVTVFLNE